MSDIEAPSHSPFKTGEGVTKVSRLSSTSDDSSAQQQSPHKKAYTPEKPQESTEKLATHETAVTLSSRLSSLEAGSQFTASYQGNDGQDRPLITAETGTYLVKYDPALQQDIEKLPPHATIEIKILTVEREIKARLIYRDPAVTKAETPPLSLPVTLELTSLGSEPPKVRTTTDRHHLPLEQQKLSYQATDLQRAEHIALESASKLKEMPLPATTTNYTLYESAVPKHNRPAIIRSTIVGNALIAQEQIANPGTPPQSSAQPPAQSLAKSAENKPAIAGKGMTPPRSAAAPSQTGPISTQAKVKADPLAANVEKLLHENMQATVIRVIPKVAAQLPDIVQKHLGHTSPLENLKTGSILTLRIESIAIPDARSDARPAEAVVTPATSPAAHPADRPGQKSAAVNRTVASRVTEYSLPEDKTLLSAKPDRPPRSKPLPQKPVAPEQQAAPEKLSRHIPAPAREFSGIVIAPGKNILDNIDKTTPSRQLSNSPYPDRPPKTSLVQPRPENGLRTVYVATPVSVIKFQSPIALKPGTVMTFSLPTQREIQTDTRKDVQPEQRPGVNAAPEGITATKGTLPETPAQGQPLAPQDSGPTNWVPTSLITAPNVAAPTIPMAMPPQPLEDFMQDWQSLSQILSVMSVAEGSPVTRSLNNRLPGVKNPAQMTSTMIFFLAAMGAKNPARTWLGPQVTQQLEKAGKADLLKMLDHDMQRIYRLGTETPVHEWRPALLPLQVGADVTAIPILTRQVADEDPDRKNNAREEDDDEKMTATRFIVELSLSQFGQLQVDGLLKSKKLDIIIRSKIMLPTEMKHKMSGMFTVALETSGYSGDLQFRDNAPPDPSIRNMIDQKIHMFRT